MANANTIKNVASKLPMGAVAIALASLVVALMVLVGSDTAQAVTVSVSPSTSTVTRGESITFTTTVQIDSNERIPVDNMRLRICSDSACNNERTSSPYNSPRSMTLSNVNPSGSYGYGYGSGADSGTTYNFGYGYGYGGSAILTYTCTVTTSTYWQTGTYYVKADLVVSDGGETHTYSSASQSFAVTAPSSPALGGGGGSVAPSPSSTAAPTTSPVHTPSPAGTPELSPPPPPPTLEPKDVAITKLIDKIDPDGVLTETVILTSHDSTTVLEIPVGTMALDADGEPLTQVMVQSPASPAPIPSGVTMMTMLDLTPDGATFDPPATVTMHYDPSLLPEGAAEQDIVLAYYDTEAGQWVSLNDITVDTDANSIRGTVSHFTQFAVLAEASSEDSVAAPTPVEPVEAPTLTDDESDGFSYWHMILIFWAAITVAIVWASMIYWLRGRASTAPNN